MTEAERIENTNKGIGEVNNINDPMPLEITILRDKLKNKDIELHYCMEGYNALRARTKAENSRLQQLIKEKDEFISASEVFTANQNQSFRQTIDRLHEKINDLQEQLKSSNDKVSELKSAQEINRELKAELKTYLPEDCINGIERKFCHFRNGDGWKCKQCAE